MMLIMIKMYIETILREISEECSIYFPRRLYVIGYISFER